MFALTIRELVARKMRLFSTGFAVLLGVTLMAGTLIFTDTLTATFDGVLEDAHSGVDAMVRAPSEVDLSYGQVGERMSAATLDAILGIGGVERAAVEVTGYAQLVGNDGRPIGDQEETPALGFNWIGTPELNPYRIVDGSPPQRDTEIVIDRASAKDAGLRVGDTVTVLTRLAPTEFTIAGIATFGTADSQAGASSVLFDDAAAQHYLSEPGMVDGIAVQAVDGLSQDELVARLSSAFPDLEVLTGAEVIAADQEAFGEEVAPFKIFLLVFAFVAVFVGAFTINNTFSIIVAQRTRQLAMLRTLGASRRQVLRSVLGEALAVGMIGSLAGLCAGVGVAFGLRRLFIAMGAALPDGPLVIDRNSMILSAAVGVGVTVVSAWLPARRAGRVAPIAAIREVAIDRAGASRRRSATGFAIVAVGVAALLAGLGGAGIELVGMGAFATLVGVAVLGPVLARPVVAVVGLVVRRGIARDMAVRNARRNPKRTARTASSLMIGVALVSFIVVLAASVKSSFGGSLDDTFTGTHIVDSGAYNGRGGISPTLATELANAPGIDTISVARVAPAAIAGKDMTLFGFTAATIDRIFDLGTVRGDLAALGADGIAVDADYAADHGWALGSSIELTLSSGSQPFTIAATYDNASEWIGDLFVDIAAFDQLAPDQLDYRIYVTGDDATLRALASAYPSAEVLDTDEFLARVNGELNSLLGVIYALLALAVLIALLGIANTLALSIFERTRELGLLRAVGMTRSQVRCAIRWEAIMISLFGTALGLCVGTFFGWASVRALSSEGIDVFTFPAGSIVFVSVVAGVAGAIAAIAPARKAAGIEVLRALTTD